MSGVSCKGVVEVFRSAASRYARVSAAKCRVSTKTLVPELAIQGVRMERTDSNEMSVGSPKASGSELAGAIDSGGRPWSDIRVEAGDGVAIVRGDPRRGSAARFCPVRLLYDP